MNTAKALRYEDYKQPPQLTVVRPQGTNKAVSTQDQPVRKVTVGDRVTSGGVDPEMGQIFAVEYMDGTTREVYVLEDNSGMLVWDDVVFLKEGRGKLKDPDSLMDYEIHDPKDKVPSSLVPKMKEALKAYLAIEHKRVMTSLPKILSL
ncbi:MAG: hypothetical protein AB7S81_03550 [Bdellovibrionales bacterium]